MDYHLGRRGSIPSNLLRGRMSHSYPQEGIHLGTQDSLHRYRGRAKFFLGPVLVVDEYLRWLLGPARGGKRAISR